MLIQQRTSRLQVVGMLLGRAWGSGLLRPSPYRFSLHDFWLYFREAAWRLPALYRVGTGGELDLLQIDGFQFYWPAAYDPGDLPWLYQEVFALAHINPHAYEWAGATIQPGEWVVDAGAGEGFFTRYALDRGARVLAVEPVPALVKALERTFASEILAGRVRVLRGLLGATEGMVLIQVDPAHPALSAQVSGTSGERAQIYTLDGLVGRGWLPAVEAIKMDIEGAEGQAIEGAVTTLRVHKPRLALAVYHSLFTARDLARRIREFRPDYQVQWRGMCRWEDPVPRPYMLYAW